MLLTAAPVTLEEAIDLLSAADFNTFWGLGIELVLKQDPTYDHVDSLIRQLEMQSHDNPDAIRRILGPYVCQKLFNL